MAIELLGADVLLPVHLEVVPIAREDGFAALARPSTKPRTLIETSANDNGFITDEDGSPQSWRGGFGAVIVRCDHTPTQETLDVLGRVLRFHGLRQLDDTARRWTYETTKGFVGQVAVGVAVLNRLEPRGARSTCQ